MIEVGRATDRHGPLQGIRFVELSGIGPVPFAAMILADLGAEGIRIEPPRPHLFGGDPTRMPTNRGRASVALDLKHPDGRETALRLVDQADLLLEGFRPGVMERLGLGPEPCLARNPRLVYGRMTGWGQHGPLADRAGHDVTYIAIAGALRHAARSGQLPTPSLNLVGDYGGGAMLLVAGVLAGLLETGRSGRGQVVDAAMVDGAALLMATFFGMRAQGLWRDEPGTNLLDTGAPFYDVYATAGGGYVAVGALEPRFYAELLAGLGLAGETDLPEQYDMAGWPVLRERFAAVFASRTRDDWAAIFKGTDACVAPVLDLDEAPRHPHLVARETFTTVEGVVQPAPAPRFSRTPASAPTPPSGHGADAHRLREWGFTEEELGALRATGVLGGG